MTRAGSAAARPAAGLRQALGPPRSLGFRLARQPHKTRSAFSSPRLRALCLAAQFTPENPTASRAFSFVMIKGEAV